ncbi:AAA family ATPase [Nannocystis pusilla]|uniref:nSTAND1 domain-containing NTPase n=1 Tax=Nannocystis pusilla TaxID=889268 RepID=UPI003BF32355
MAKLSMSQEEVTHPSLEDERVISESGIREIFTPSHPIFSPTFFYGRKEQVGMLLSQINTPGQHSLLFGNRGVGKSSLANFVSGLSSRKAITLRCDSHTTFQQLAEEIRRGFSESDRRLTIPLVGAHSGRDFAPSFLRENVGNADGLILIDEAEALRNSADRQQLAEFIKHLSDSNSRLKILIVGVAETGAGLIGAHPSIGRCLKEVYLKPMTDTEIVQIIRGGAEKAQITFDERLTLPITQLSAGYPHFAHLLALKCAEIAILARSKTVRYEWLRTAMRRAAQDAENSLSVAYLEATRSTTSMYKHVLLAAATIENVEFSASALRQAIELVTGDRITQGSLNNYLKNLCSDDGSRILRRVKTGVYRFQDPRMKSYVKIKNEHVPASERYTAEEGVAPDFYEILSKFDE